ncbi:Kynureninase [Papilio xuthus]|uniref:Kynureninase n=1 Tax=Papilio xuthus TaxID=66420 RepID=A0A194QLX1_PAPXU|nr:Kynureninase [Papilio xuthus]
MNRNFKEDVEYPKTLDRLDPLRQFTHRFYQTKGEIYLCGHSVGLASIDAEKSLNDLLEVWKKEGVRIWMYNNYQYVKYSSLLAELMAPLIKVQPNEIVISGSCTSNIHVAMCTLYKPTIKKYKVLVDDINFASDRYAVDSQVRLNNLAPSDAVKVVRCQGSFMKEDLIINSMTTDVALLLLPAVYYKTSQVLELKRICEKANELGIIIGLDISHAIGVIDLDLQILNIDFAVWCTYKYLNGGPGSCAGLYMNKKHFKLSPGLAGWYGNKDENRFQFKQEFDHQRNANGWQIGTPSLFSMAPLKGSLEIFNEAGINNIRKKSLHITAYLMYLIDTKLVHYGFSVGNLREDEKRGGHVSIIHVDAQRISLSLKSRGVVTDFREPDIMRVTPIALYTTYLQVYQFVEILLDIMKSKTY